MVRNSQKKPAHLPERLTISFPIWGLFATKETDIYCTKGNCVRRVRLGCISGRWGDRLSKREQ